MERLGYITCDERPDQPLCFGKEGGKYFFIYHNAFGGHVEDTKIDIPFDEIDPLSNFDGTAYIGTRIGKTWTLWRYSLWNYNDSNNIPYCVHMFKGKLLEELTGVSADSFEACLKRYSIDEYHRYWNRKRQ